jgi:DNA-binding response OmpR family regulator
VETNSFMSAPIIKLRVLVVEDEDLIAMFVEDMLTDMGHEVGAIAARMEDGLREAETGSFDFAIVDVNLDGVPSYPVAEVLRARGIPFVFATGYGAAGLDPRFVGASTLQKPFTEADLYAVLAPVVASK